MPKEKDPQYNTEWTDPMLARFLEATQRNGDFNDPDFDAAVYAFRFIPAWEFHRYIELFKAAGKNINAKSASGLSILSYFEQFPRAQDYADLMREAGAE